MHGCQDLEEMVFPDFSRFSLTKLEKFPWPFFRRNMNFGWQSDFPTIQGFQLDFFQEYFHYGWWKFWIFIIWNCSRMKDFSYFSENNFTMVEENFEFWWSEMAPKWRISAIFPGIFWPWFKRSNCQTLNASLAQE